ncbi:MAG: hypothetical protein OEZ02_04560, partial [Anaerolineae bacterium]|nr:hypothetical protein [Anaerolineae bacterium]
MGRGDARVAPAWVCIEDSTNWLKVSELDSNIKALTQREFGPLTRAMRCIFYAGRGGFGVFG